MGEGSTYASELQLKFSEQQLRSALSEPVQRLPRYTLFLDNILILLPSSHTARSHMVKARELLAEICALDINERDGKLRKVKLLRNLVEKWPSDLKVQGRFVTAVDIEELRPPYDGLYGTQPSIFVLFAGTLVLLRRIREASTSARGLIAEIERSTIMEDLATKPEAGKQLLFVRSYDLDGLRTSESPDDDLLYISETASRDVLPHDILTLKTKVFSLQAPYYAKASKFTEELLKAKIEARFPIDIRESERWSLRSVETSNDKLGILAAITEVYCYQSLQDQHSLGKVRLQLIDSVEHTSRESLGIGAEVFGCISISRGGEYILAVKSAEQSSRKEVCTRGTLSSIFQSQGKLQ